MALYFKHSFELQYGELMRDGFDGFSMEVPVDGIIVYAKIIKDEGDRGRQIQTDYQADISSELLEKYEDPETDLDDWPQSLREEGSRIRRRADIAANRLTYALKFLLMINSLPVKVNAGFSGRWSKDGESWNRFPSKTYITDERLTKVPQLDDAARERIQQFLNSDEELLTPALLHLHRAKQHDEPRYRWIDATIAAELAIKEFLIRKYPDFKTLLIALPSPPLHKLYGEVLESLIGERSPKLKALHDGATKRNELIHRPTPMKISEEELRKYIDDVEVAIYHLMSFLYPENHLLRFVLENRRTVEPKKAPRKRQKRSG